MEGTGSAVLGSLSGLAPWQQLVLVVVAAAVAARLATLVGGWLVRRAAREDGEVADVLLEELRLPIYATVVLGAVYLSAGVVARLPIPVERLAALAAKLSVTGIVVAWAYGAIRFGRRGLEAAREDGTHYEFAPILTNVWTLAVALVALLTLMGTWGVNLTPILASAGVIGIVLGVAAQDSIANLVGGVSLFFDNTYKVGDFVELESGERGTVVDIGIRSTTLLTPDSVLVTVPNSVLNTAQVVNMSAPQRRTRIRVDVRVPYDADLDRAEACMFEAAGAAGTVLETPGPQVRIQQYAERGVEYELHCHVSNPMRGPRARHQVYRELHEALEREGIDVPYAGRDVRYVDGAPSDDRRRRQRARPPEPGDE